MRNKSKPSIKTLKNKPFCGGTHTSFCFSDDKPPEIPDKKETYKGKNIIIHDNIGICAHAGFCTTNLPTVFKTGGEPWIDPAGDTVERIKETIRMCPSGALSF